MIYADANVLIRLIEGMPQIRAPIETRLQPFRGTAQFLISSRLSRLECRCKPLRESNLPLLKLYDALFSSWSSTCVKSTSRWWKKQPPCELH